MGQKHDSVGGLTSRQWETQIPAYSDLPKSQVDARIPGFSAGSYSGLSMCHLHGGMPHVSVCRTLGLIALQMLFHYTSDTLCQWRPGSAILGALACKYCIVSNSELELRLFTIVPAGSMPLPLCSEVGK